MKSIKNSVLVAMLLVFAANFNSYAQDVKSATDKVKKEQKDLKQDKDQAKDKIKQQKEEMKEKKNELKRNADTKSDDANDGATSYSDLKDDKIGILEEKLKKARTDKEREEIMRMIEAEKKTAKNDAGAKLDEIKNDSDAAVNDATNDGGSGTSLTDVAKDYDKNKGKGNAYGKDKGDLKGRDFGKARAEDARAKLTKKEQDLVGKEQLVKNGRARIAGAKERLAAAIAGGSLTEDEIARKQAMIDRAEAGIDKLEASINAGKAAYTKQKTTLSEVYDNN